MNIRSSASLRSAISRAWTCTRRLRASAAPATHRPPSSSVARPTRSASGTCGSNGTSSIPTRPSRPSRTPRAASGYSSPPPSTTTSTSSRRTRSTSFVWNPSRTTTSGVHGSTATGTWSPGRSSGTYGRLIGMSSGRSPSPKAGTASGRSTGAARTPSPWAGGPSRTARQRRAHRPQ